MRQWIPSLFIALSAAACNSAGVPVVTAATPEPFDAYRASLTLSVGMPEVVAISRIGSQPVSSQVIPCGALSGHSGTCELLKFGAFENNQLYLYVEATDDGRTFVTGWLVQKG